MSDFQAFDELIISLQGAVIKSQELTQNQHLALMSKYFDKDGNPLMLKIKIPSAKTDVINEQEKNAQNSDKNDIKIEQVLDKYKIIEIPAFCLVPQNSLAMKKVKMDFDVKLVDFGKKEVENNKTTIDGKNKTANEKVLTNLLRKNQNKKQIITNVFANTEDTNSIHVEIEFINKEPPEGIMRVNDMMIRMVP